MVMVKASFHRAFSLGIEFACPVAITLYCRLSQLFPLFTPNAKINTPPWFL
jgi:hypothetical protein